MVSPHLLTSIGSLLGTHGLAILPTGRLDLDLVEEIRRPGCGLESGVDLLRGGLEDEGATGVGTIVDPVSVPFVGRGDELLGEAARGGIPALDFEATMDADVDVGLDDREL